MADYDIVVGDPMIWFFLGKDFLSLENMLRLLPDDLADMSIKDLKSTVKKTLCLLKDIHVSLATQSSIQKQLARIYAEVTTQINEGDKAHARFLLSLELCKAQVAGDVEQEKHWQQMFIDSWDGEVPPKVTKEYLLNLLGKLQDLRGTFANSPLTKYPNFSRRMTATILENRAMFTEMLPFAVQEAQGLKVDKKLKAAVMIRYSSAPTELAEITKEMYQYMQNAIDISTTRYEDMQENFELRVAELADLLAHIYKRTHASDWRRRTSWWKKRQGLKVPQ